MLKKEEIEWVDHLISEWDKNDCNMQKSYPYGLGQYLTEVTSASFETLCYYIAKQRRGE